MNARSNTFEIKCAEHQINDIVSALFHSVLYYRTHGKVTYKNEYSYSVGTLGYEEVTCDFFNFTYIRCASSCLVESLNRSIKDFTDKLRDSNQSVGVISLEFFKRKKTRGMMVFFNDPSLVWEIWSIKITLVNDECSRTEEIENLLLDKLITIVQIVNGSRCNIPQMPDQRNVDSVFDVSYEDAQPYLHRITYRIGSGSNSSLNQAGVGDLGFRKFIKDAFAL
ncbi:autophagy-related protein 101 [Brevipalpus obovatus]|uniref:autophagy-related protein 101 n=1 Tax=Brevipalpus obovatus TaxID=246614 RepID=UPI003D9DC9E9